MNETPKTPARLSLTELRVGNAYAFSRTLSEQDLKTFAVLSGDENPLHCDPAFAALTEFKLPIVHGMLAASLFSTLVGMHCPGRTGVYLSQTLEFKKPIFPGELLTVMGTILEKHESTGIVVLQTDILKGIVVAVTGQARVKVNDALI